MVVVGTPETIVEVLVVVSGGLLSVSLRKTVGPGQVDEGAVLRRMWWSERLDDPQSYLRV